MAAFEQHYKISELAKKWGYSEPTIRPWFEDEPDCLVDEYPETMHKRRYKSIRVPRSTAERVYAQHVSHRESSSNAGGKKIKS
jgi:hypothetical protein